MSLSSWLRMREDEERNEIERRLVFLKGSE